MTELRLAYNMLRASLDGSTPNTGTEAIDADSWWALFRLLQCNHVAALCYEAAAAAGAPRGVLMPWLAEHEKTVGWHRHQKQVQQEIADTMAKHGIDTLVLKGTYVAKYYPRPEEREFSDLDLYFYDKHDEADRVAREVLKVTVSNDSHHHSKYNYNGVTVESHYDFVNVHYPPSNRRYEAMLKRVATSPTFEVLFLLRHMACHFAASRITLRDLVDWTLTCQALKDDVDWQMVQNAVEDYGMESFVACLCTLSAQLLPDGSCRVGEGDVQCGGMKVAKPEEECVARVVHDIVYGSHETDDRNADGMERLGWKLRRWRALGWKRRMVYNDSPLRLLLASLTSHAEKPQSILHKM